MVLTITMLLTISFVFGIREEPPLCGKGLITNLVDDERGYTATPPYPELRQDLLPYVASVQRFDTDSTYGEDVFDKRLSGAFVGTILGPAVVLVACRCVARYMGLVGEDKKSVWTARQFGVMAGTPWDYSPVDGMVGQIRFASRVVVHPKCELRPSLYLWDLAVMVLKSPFEFIRGQVEAAPIPVTSQESKEFLRLAASQTVAGFTAAWGWAFNSHKPKHLKLKLHPVFVRQFDSCDHSTAGYSAAHIVPTDMHVCVETAASYLRLQRTGDAGSPLLGFLGVNSTTKAVQYIVLGIKSEENDATPDGFSLFTRLDIDLDWLWSIRRTPPDPRGAASATDITSLQVLLILNWTRILNVLGSC